MILSEQTAVILEAINDELLQPEDLVRWADSVIAAMEQPPSWLLDLSTLGSLHMQDYVSRLREHAQGRMPTCRQIAVIVLAYDAGLLFLRDTLRLLFRLAIIERQGRTPDAVAEALAGALITWDCQENLDVIEPSLQARFEALSPEYLRDAHDIAAVIPWKLQCRAEPGAAPLNGGPGTPVGRSGASEGPPPVT
jgi:hypothetical protein